MSLQSVKEYVTLMTNSYMQQFHVNKSQMPAN
jgi:hypothetical protein